jgi:hypothetical protein
VHSFFSTTSSRNIEGASPRLERQIDREAQRRGKAGMAVSSYAEPTKLCGEVDLGIHSERSTCRIFVDARDRLLPENTEMPVVQKELGLCAVLPSRSPRNSKALN